MELTFDDIAMDLDNLGYPLDLDRVFSRSAPLHVEVGSGKGTFLLNQAGALADVNFLGIEWANKFYRYCVDRLRRWQMENVRVVRADARDFIRLYLPDESVEWFHIYFPDPWPKKRHHKRRFFTEDNMGQVLRTLKAGGRLQVATDYEEYYEVIRDLLTGDGDTAKPFEEIAFQPPKSAAAGEWVGSNFERKYQADGREIYTLALRKR
ncbi:MAG: tRNA (guanosine(46)-N7)-methyltransferase TrmB [Planctomycetes bacterium]|nr:tRNA (guanosine(46)-N7)-methyltransferase TrmB [Planctomycetota bacterium]